MQNINLKQLNACIIMYTITIGIDISDINSMIHFKDQNGKLHHRSFENNECGFEQFLSYLLEICKLCNWRIQLVSMVKSYAIIAIIKK